MVKKNNTNNESNSSASTITPPVSSVATATAARATAARATAARLRAIVVADLQESGDGEVRHPITPNRNQNIHRREQRQN